METSVLNLSELLCTERILLQYEEFNYNRVYWNVAMMSDTIHELLLSAVKNIAIDKEIAISFSGGIDSGILAAMASEYAKNVTLYTVGTKDSHDVLKAKEASVMLNLEQNHILLTEDNISDLLKDMISISGTMDPLTLSFEIPTYAVTCYSKESNIIGGIGADELFGGYHKYIGMSPEEFREARIKDMERLFTFVIPHEDRVAEHFNKTLHRPYTDKALIKEVMSIPCKEILPSENRPRKLFLRQVAEKMDLPLLASTEKKSAQYGSGAMRIIRKLARKEGLTVNEYILSLSDDGTDNIHIQ